MDGTGGLGDQVRRWLTDAGLSPAAAARRAGVSGSTLHRVLHDAVDPSVGTLREIAFACGLSLDLGAHPVSDPAAAASARATLETGYTPGLPGVDAWHERLRRHVGSDEPVALVEAAGRASAPLLRAETVLLRGTVTMGRLASAGQASEARWAISGLAGFIRPGLWEDAPAPTILWSENPRRIQQLLADAGLERTNRWQRTHLAICQADPALFVHSFEEGHVRYAAPIQILLDGFSLGGAAADRARQEAMSW